jgi:hypothetical protein
LKGSNGKPGADGIEGSIGESGPRGRNGRLGPKGFTGNQVKKSPDKTANQTSNIP